MYRQYELQAGDKHQVCWLKEPQALTVGMEITLKNDDTRWKIVHKHGIVLEKPPLKDWSNNI